ncbi:MAG: hypothetical protein JNN00_00025 [Chitinophagaceae bacterium]|nr:hypothetical protein [Chitinophagaceae bacterium]
MDYCAYRKIIITFVVLFACSCSFSQVKETVTIVQQSYASPRIKYGIAKLSGILQKAGYRIIITNKKSTGNKQKSIIIGELKSELFGKEMRDHTPGKEGYIIASLPGNSIYIGGADPSGVLYGCLELAGQIKETGALPSAIAINDQPEMVLRGACIGLQKPYYLPGRNVYEYPYTPQTFPWFYDKKLWIQVLDSLLENRMNSLYLWNGHPFASLVKLKDYPYAVEVDDATFRKNEEMFRFITTEADKRGIWVIQMFYNIIVSKPFAEYHKIKTQERERPIIPVIADYTRKSIAAFVQKYPNVGLMVCLGEAMEGTGNDDIEWFTKTIIPGVQDGLKLLGKKEEPPIVLRAHDTDAPSVMRAALPLYKNLYTEAKFNGEALTYPRPRGKWAELHQTLSKLGSVQIENVHILANLEPFRYGSPDFIQQSVIGMHEVMGGNGLHLYPQASYWDWPYSADSVKGKRLLQIERDWIWYKAWSRYAWKAKRDRSEEISYWSRLLSEKYGCSVEDGKKILEAYEESGEIAPKLLRRFGITDGNRQTMTLGMLMTQLINPYRYGLFTLLYESESPEGEMLIQFAEKEWKGEPHIGETPVQVIEEVKEHGDHAVASIESVAASVTKGKEEFERLKNDMYCYKQLAYHYAQKAEAALDVLRYKYSGDISDLEAALPLLEQSIISYRQLVQLTRESYLYANSMQTQQRKIPLRGVDGTFKTWREVLRPFQEELRHFKAKVDSLKSASGKAKVLPVVLNNAMVNVQGDARYYLVDSLARVFTDTGSVISTFAGELKGLRGLKLSFQEQIKNGTEIRFSSEKPVKVLVGYFKTINGAFTKDTVFLGSPELETNASANDYGQAETKIANAMVIDRMPAINVHSYSFPKGNNTLKLGKGACLVLGFVDEEQLIPLYDAGLTESGIKKEIDWLFE